MLQEIDNSDLFNTIVLDNFTNATIDPQTDTIDENNQTASHNQKNDLSTTEAPATIENTEVANNSEQCNNCFKIKFEIPPTVVKSKHSY